MIVCYSGKTQLSAEAIADEDDDITLLRRSRGDINWGRASANTSLNPDISNATNKRRMRELFRDNSVPMPELLSISDIRSDYARGIRYKVVGRPDRHTKGRGLWIVDSPERMRRALRGTRRKRAATHFMRYIDAPHEYRVHVFKGRSIRISEKLQGSYGSTAHGDYTTIKPTGNIRHVRKAAKKAVVALGLDFGAVDILADDENCWVLEVNTAPGLGGSMPRLYAEVFRQWYEGEW